MRVCPWLVLCRDEEQYIAIAIVHIADSTPLIVCSSLNRIAIANKYPSVGVSVNKCHCIIKDLRSFARD